MKQRCNYWSSTKLYIKKLIGSLQSQYIVKLKTKKNKKKLKKCCEIYFLFASKSREKLEELRICLQCSSIRFRLLLGFTVHTKLKKTFPSKLKCKTTTQNNVLLCLLQYPFNVDEQYVTK